MKPFKQLLLPLTIDGVDIELAVLYRQGTDTPLMFLHGFGSTKEDYADIIFQSALDDHSFIAYDAPGCGRSICSAPEKVTIPFLVKVAKAVLDHFKVTQLHLSGHSMGGLTSLMLAHELGNRVLSFTDIEGNIAPEDCFLSRQIIEYPANDPYEFFNRFIERALHAPAYASALYSASLQHKVDAHAVHSIFSSMVELSDSGDLMERFLSLPCRKMFMYGEQNDHLSYLSHIKQNGVRLSRIPECGHFPMYSNPTIMWREIIDFVSI